MYCLSSFTCVSILSTRLSMGLDSICRTATKARIIPLFISIAGLEFKTLLSIATPSSVKAKGRYFILLPRPLFKVANCVLESSVISFFVSSNIKSSPSNLSILRLTASLRRFVSTPYISARSKSNITFCPLISYILLCINCRLSIIALVLFISFPPLHIPVVCTRFFFFP